MATWRVNNSTTLGGEVLSRWQANHAYALGARMVPSNSAAAAARKRVYECTTAGTSHATTEPTWETTVDGTTADGAGTLVWTCRNPTGSSWDNATILFHALAQSAAGDIIWVHYQHNERYASAITVTSAGTATSPLQIISVDKADNSARVGAVYGTTTGTYTLTINGTLYSYGVTWCAAQGIWLAYASYTNVQQVFEMDGPSSVVFDISIDGTTGYLMAGNGYTTTHIIRNAAIRLNKVGAYMQLGSGSFNWINGTLLAPAEVATLFAFNMGAMSLLKNVDLSAMCAGATARYLLAPAEAAPGLLLDRCKMPAGAGFSIANTGSYPFKELAGVYPEIRIHHSSSSSQSYQFYERGLRGLSQHETTIVRTGGASNGDTPFSCKMASSALFVKDNLQGLALPSIPIAGWLSGDASQTITVEGITDSAANLQNDEVWMEVVYPADGTSGLGALASTKCAMLGTPADLASSTIAWTTTGITNVNKFKFTATIDPGKVGPVEVIIYLAKANTTIYIDPVITVG